MPSAMPWVAVTSWVPSAVVRRGFVVAGEVEGRGGRSQAEGEEGAGGEELLVIALGDQDAFHQVQQTLAPVPPEYQGAPGDPQADPERSRVGAVAADVAHEGVEQAVVCLHHVEEVPAEQGHRRAGQVAGGHFHGGCVEEWLGQQAALQTGVLLCPQPGGLGFGARAFGLAPVGGVANGAAQQVRFDLPLDEVVLCSRSHGVGTRLGLGQSGQDDDRGVWGQGADGGDRVDARYVGQVQVEKNAVGHGAGQFGTGLRQCGPGGQLEPQSRVVQELFDEQCVTLIVFDEEDAVGRLGGIRRCGVGRGVPCRP